MPKMKDTKYDLNKLRGRIVEKYRTQAAFAVALGVSEKSLILKLSGKTYFTLPEISKAVRLLELSHSAIQEYFFTEEVQKC